MTLLKTILPVLIFLLLSSPVFSDSIRVSQIDSSSLLLNQEIKLYLSVTDNSGQSIGNLSQSNFEVLESGDGKSFSKSPEIVDFQAGSNFTEGVSFLLLIDNSESMYWTMEGNKSNQQSKRRINIARNAVRSFVGSIKSPNDKIGLAVYNSYYNRLAKPSGDLKEVEKKLEEIQRPKGDAIYSEIYGSLNFAVEELEIVKGRKAVIILSDGVNNPYYNHTKKINQQFGARYISYEKPLIALQNEGISLYVIYFGKRTDKKDRHLKTIAKESGGVTFDAHNEKELSQVYSKIMQQIQKEYVLTYKATMDPADKKIIKVNYKRGSNGDTVQRYYLSTSVFGKPSDRFNLLIFVAVLIAFLLLWLLSKLRFERQNKQPSIEVLNAGAGKISTQVLTLGGDETVIGSSPSADMTIAGLPAVGENHATIAFDASKETYILKGNGKMLVNNQMVETKILEPGDLINIDGMTMVFDEGSESKK